MPMAKPLDETADEVSTATVSEEDTAVDVEEMVNIVTAQATPAPTSSSSFPASPPPKFLEHPGPPPLNYTVWYKLFERFLFLLDAGRPADGKLTDEMKNSYLFSTLGCEGARQFASNPKFGEMSTATHDDYRLRQATVPGDGKPGSRSLRVSEQVPTHG